MDGNNNGGTIIPYSPGTWYVCVCVACSQKTTKSTNMEATYLSAILRFRCKRSMFSKSCHANAKLVWSDAFSLKILRKQGLCISEMTRAGLNMTVRSFERSVQGGNNLSGYMDGRNCSPYDSSRLYLLFYPLKSKNGADFFPYHFHTNPVYLRLSHGTSVFLKLWKAATQHLTDLPIQTSSCRCCSCDIIKMIDCKWNHSEFGSQNGQVVR